MNRFTPWMIVVSILCLTACHGSGVPEEPAAKIEQKPPAGPGLGGNLPGVTLETCKQALQANKPLPDGCAALLVDVVNTPPVVGCNVAGKLYAINATIACACPDGSTSSQVCQKEGSLSSCQCKAVTTPQGCTPGAKKSCTVGGKAGTQICKTDGSDFDICTVAIIPTVCTAGQTQSCTMSDGTDGSQTCKADGSGYDACSATPFYSVYVGSFNPVLTNIASLSLCGMKSGNFADDIVDASLKSLILKNLGKTDGDTITPDEANGPNGLYYLLMDKKNPVTTIKSLTGLSCFENLQSVDVHGNPGIEDKDMKYLKLPELVTLNVSGTSMTKFDKLPKYMPKLVALNAENMQKPFSLNALLPSNAGETAKPATLTNFYLNNNKTDGSGVNCEEVKTLRTATVDGKVGGLPVTVIALECDIAAGAIPETAKVKSVTINLKRVFSGKVKSGPSIADSPKGKLIIKASVENGAVGNASEVEEIMMGPGTTITIPLKPLQPLSAVRNVTLSLQKTDATDYVEIIGISIVARVDDGSPNGYSVTTYSDTDMEEPLPDTTTPKEFNLNPNNLSVHVRYVANKALGKGLNLVVVPAVGSALTHALPVSSLVYSGQWGCYMESFWYPNNPIGDKPTVQISYPIIAKDSASISPFQVWAYQPGSLDYLQNKTCYVNKVQKIGLSEWGASPSVQPLVQASGKDCDLPLTIPKP